MAKGRALLQAWRRFFVQTTRPSSASNQRNGVAQLRCAQCRNPNIRMRLGQDAHKLLAAIPPVAKDDRAIQAANMCDGNAAVESELPDPMHHIAPTHVMADSH